MALWRDHKAFNKHAIITCTVVGGCWLASVGKQASSEQRRGQSNNSVQGPEGLYYYVAAAAAAAYHRRVVVSATQ